MPLVSVIIPCYNAASYLPEAIESVINQTYKEFELIVVDDGSIDNTKQVISKYREYLKYLLIDHLGPGAARNAGIRSARGEYLMFLDADDYILPRKLELQANYLDNNPDIDVVYSDGFLEKIGSNGLIERKLFSNCGMLIRSLSDPSKRLPNLMIQNAFPIHAAMVRKITVLEIGGFDEERDLIEDWDFWYRIAENHRFGFVDEILVIYRSFSSLPSRNKIRHMEAFRGSKRKIEKSKSFKILSGKLKSQFYFSWGVQELNYAEPKEAMLQFNHALQYNLNILAFLGYLSTFMFGERAVIFYLFKRKVIDRY